MALGLTCLFKNLFLLSLVNDGENDCVRQFDCTCPSSIVSINFPLIQQYLFLVGPCLLVRCWSLTALTSFHRHFTIYTYV